MDLRFQDTRFNPHVSARALASERRFVVSSEHQQELYCVSPDTDRDGHQVVGLIYGFDLMI